MRKLLLVSTSTTHGTGYLEHCAPQILDLFHGAGVEHVLFVPYALHDRDAYAEQAKAAFLEMGLGLESIHQSPDPFASVEAAEGIFIGGGNTFRLLKALYDHDLIDPIRRRVLAGMPYLGTSAGSNVACPTIMTSNDMPIVYPPSFDALNLVPFQINAHYLDADPGSTHMGETRETRIREFHEENATPVVALREGAMLVVEEHRLHLAGDRGGKLFRRGSDPLECLPGKIIAELRTE
jgi:dipeptidase E